MATLLIHNAHTVATQNDQGEELRETSVLVRDGLIAAIGPASDMPHMADEVIDIADGATNESERVARLRIDARKWLASRWNPGIYGERTGPLVQIDLAGAHLRAVRPVDQPAPQTITIDIPTNDS
jgi:hypothetical protein